VGGYFSSDSHLPTWEKAVRAATKEAANLVAATVIGQTVLRVPQESFSRLVGRLNWDDLGGEQEPSFQEAIQMAWRFLIRPAIRKALGRVISRDRVKVVLAAARLTGLAVFDQYEPAWTEVILEEDRERRIRFVVYPTTDSWRCQQVPLQPHSALARQSFPSAWLSLSNQAFQEASGVSDATFCHRAGFLCGAKSKEGALRLAELALRLGKRDAGRP
jgi:uncharacterized UPF0160 family protein